jgi:hypothetical protein
VRISFVLRVLCAVVLLVALGGCTSGPADKPGDGSHKVSTAAPKLGSCRRLQPADISRSTDDSRTVGCAAAHTAQTFAIGSFPAALARSTTPDDEALGAYVYRRCETRFQRFVGGNQSLVLRSTMTWAWFRATRQAWTQGAHWWRCDIVGGGEQSSRLVPLPRTAKGLLLGRPDDRWLVCVAGPTVAGSPKIPCSQKHTWRAVSTVVLGKPKDRYPGDRLVEVRTRDFCSASVGAWMNYPVDYDYGYTWFHEAEWKAGNRRSICWAKTTQ